MDNELNQNQNNNETNELTVGEDGKITMTQEELAMYLQRETDRRVTAAVRKTEAKSEQKIREAQKLAQMDEKQRYEAELEMREKAIAEKEKALALAENTNVASKILSEKGLSLQLAQFVVAEDAETMNERISVLEKAFKASVRAEVEKRIGTGAPQKPVAQDETLTKEGFKKLSLMQKQELYQTNPELYKQLTK